MGGWVKRIGAMLCITIPLSPHPTIPLLQAQEPDTVPRSGHWLRLGISGEGRFVQHRVDAGNGNELRSGTLFGGSGVAGLGEHVEVGLSGATGTLNVDSGLTTSGKLARAEGHIAVLPIPWLALRAGVALHTFSAGFASQRWTSARIGGEARLLFLGGKLRGIVGFELYPIVSVSGQPKPTSAFGAASGLRYASGPMTAALLYEFERYDFPAVAGVARREQLGTIVLALGFRR